MNNNDLRRSVQRTPSEVVYLEPAFHDRDSRARTPSIAAAILKEAYHNHV
jgi:hypothetical protein